MLTSQVTAAMPSSMGGEGDFPNNWLRASSSTSSAMTPTTLTARASVRRIIRTVVSLPCSTCHSRRRAHATAPRIPRPTTMTAPPSRMENWAATPPKITTIAASAILACVYVGPRRCPVRRAMPSRGRGAHRAAERPGGEEARALAEQRGDLGDDAAQRGILGQRRAAVDDALDGLAACESAAQERHVLADQPHERVRQVLRAHGRELA